MKSKQQGVVILTFLTIILLGITTLLVTQLSTNKRTNQRQTNHISSLSDAKQALVGYAMTHPIPGTLPCPDATGDGLANPQGLNCQSLLGLLPTRTLNLGNTQDGTGADLWYAVDANYTANSPALKNSSINTALMLDGTPVAGVVIAPGKPLGAQARRPLTRTDFLEGLNADGDFTNFESNQSDTQNDRVSGLAVATYWSQIEQRVLVTAKALVNDYRNQCGEYPWAANFGGPFNSVNNQQLGALPLNSASPDDWSSICATGVTPTPPAWLVNHWASQIQYRMCQTIEGTCVTILGSNDSPASGVLVAPGVAIPGQARPDNDLVDYFEDENINLPDSEFRQASAINHTATYNDTTLSLNP